MRLYRNLPKRIAIKKIGGKDHYNYLQWAVDLKPGTLINTCNAYNEPVRRVYPYWTKRGCSKGSYIYDADIEVESGLICSLFCCGVCRCGQSPPFVRRQHAKSAALDFACLPKVESERRVYF